MINVIQVRYIIHLVWAATPVNVVYSTIGYKQYG
jgi:hypothetical protein